MTITPQEALRRSKAAALAVKHGSTLFYPNGERANDEWEISSEQLADLIDEATAAKDEVIKRLRAELNESYKEGQREARDAYSEGRSNEAAYQRGEPPDTY